MFMIRIVVPLPDERQRPVSGFAIKFVGCDDAGDESIAGRKFVEFLRCLAVHAENRPAVLPSRGNQPGEAAHRAVVAEQIGIPIAVGRIDQSALCDALVLHGDATFIGAGDLVGAVDEHGAAPAAFRRGDIEEVILAVDLEELGTLGAQTACFIGAEQQVCVFDDHLVDAVRHNAREVGKQFG